ncbi:MAG: SPFH domain-containing protein, partial [Planctomycetota bacterium]
MFENLQSVITTIIGTLIVLYLISTAINFIRQTERGLVERFGKYDRFAEPGLKIIIPLIERIEVVNITERMVDAAKQEIITKDKLNASVDAQIYFKVKADEESVKNSVYSVDDVELQTVSLARTTLRNIVGTTTLTDANSGRDTINSALLIALVKETKAWGIDILRTELKEIDPPKQVQDSMNQVVVAENEKTAAVDFASAAETQADGIKRAAIKKAEGVKEALILEATGKAEALTLVNNAVENTFTEKAQMLRKLETVEVSLANNTKIVLPADGQLINVISELA